jgi:hypothetical protein
VDGRVAKAGALNDLHRDLSRRIRGGRGWRSHGRLHTSVQHIGYDLPDASLFHLRRQQIALRVNVALWDWLARQPNRRE